MALSFERDGHHARALQEMHEAGVVVHALPMQRAVRPRADVRSAKRLGGLLAEVQPTLVHTHGSKAGVLGRVVARRWNDRVPQVHTAHGFAFEKRAEFGALRRRIFRSIERHLARKTDALVVLSERERELVRRELGRPGDQVHLIPNGVAVEDVHEERPRRAARRSLGIPEDACVAFHAGILLPEKGQEDLLQAWSSSPPSWRLYLAGSGPLEARLQERARHFGIAHRVTFLGQREDVDRWLDACDLAVLPSRSEASPYFALEALARGRALLATRVSGVEDLVEEGRNGWLVEPAAPAVLARRLESLPALPTVHAAGERGPRSVRARHTAEQMARSHVRLYEMLLASAP